MARIAIVESVGISADHETRRRSAHHLYADWICTYVRDELESKGLHERRQQAFSLALVGAVNELIVDWTLQSPEQRCSVDELVDVIAELAMVVLLRI